MHFLGYKCSLEATPKYTRSCEICQQRTDIYNSKNRGKLMYFIGAAFEERYDVHHAMMGKAELRLMRQRELVDFAVEWIEKNRR